MAKIHDLNDQTALDMKAARRNTSIHVDQVRDFIHHGSNEFRQRKKIVDILKQDAAFDKSKRDFMTRTERYTRGLSMTNRIHELQAIHKWTQQDTSIATTSLDESLPISLHSVAFQPVFMSQGGATLVKKYGDLISCRAILGCYLQTELGHGTNVSGLETTATYLSDSKEFEIHSPTLTSSKWWIGALGRTSTHGVVQAKLILPGGKDVGPHLFFIQLRSMKDHKALPGIIMGDIGPKALAGCSPTDNGFARFDRVRIPKENMLSQFAQVTDEGKYIVPPHAKLSYGGMLYIRANMVTGGGWLMAKAATVAIRYATVRRQGEEGADGLERQIISYPSVYYRLIPILSHAYVFIMLGRVMVKSFEAMAARLASGDASLLGEVHAITSGLKILVSSTGVQDLETARRSMGGHGYSAFAGLGRLYADYLPSVTYEGDNFVLDKQVVRAALKSYRNLFASSKPSANNLPPSSGYLRLLLDPASRPSILANASWRDASSVILLLEWRAALLVREYVQNAENPDANANQRTSKAVSEAFVATQVGEILKNIQQSGLEGKDTVALSNVYLLYLLMTLEAGLVDLLSFGVWPSLEGKDSTRSLRLVIQDVCKELLPEAVGLSDAFGFSDWELDSALGVYDGKVYEALWDRTQMEPINQTEIPDGYLMAIKPMLERGQRLAAGRGSKL